MGLLSQLLWEWRPNAACPGHLWKSDGDSMPPYGERLGSGAVRSLCRGVASSEAEMTYPLERGFATLVRGGGAGRSREVSTGTLERGGVRPAGSRGARMGRTLGFFESFPFFQIGRRPWAFVGSVA